MHALPVGNAGNITAYWKGYTEYHRDGLSTGCRACWAPRPPARPRWCSASRSSEPETIATAIRIGSPASWTSAVEAQQQSNGRFLAATDEEILAAYHLVARTEGVFVEPASAASIAGLLKSVEDGWVARGSTVVCTVTGNGLKDPDTALKGMPTVTPVPVDPVSPWSRKLGTGLSRCDVMRSQGTRDDADSARRADGQRRRRGVQRQPRARVSTVSAWR